MRFPLHRFVCLWIAFTASYCVAFADITLRYVVWDGVTSLPVLRGAVARFEDAHPGIHVRLESANYNSYFTKLLTQYAADVAPDVAMLDSNNFQKFAKRGALLPLNPFFGLLPGFQIGDYYPEIVKAHSWNGQLYVLPRDIAPEGLIYYNKRLFDQAHIPYPDGSWTWDFHVRPNLKDKDFLWVMRQLTKTDAAGKVTCFGFAPFYPGAFVDMLVFSQGARYANNGEAPTKVLFNDPRILRAHQLLQDIYQKDHWAPTPTELSSSYQSTGWQLFVNQKVAMYQCGIWDSSNIRDAMKPGDRNFFEWDIAMAPAYKDGTRAYPTGGSGYAILSSTRHPKEAWELTAWMAGPEAMLPMAAAGIAQPAIRRLAITTPWIPNAAAPRAEQYPKNRIITDREVKHVVFAPTADYWPELNTFLGSKQDSIWNGTISARDGLDQATEEAQNRLNQILKTESLPTFNWFGAWLFAGALFFGVVGWIYYPDRKRRLRGSQRQESRIAYAFISPWLIGMILFTLGPMLLSLLMGFTDWDIIRPARFRALGNYVEMFCQDPRFWKAVSVTLVYTAFSVPLGIMVSLALALLLNAKVRGIAIYRTCFYLPALASTVASSLIWRKIFSQDGGLLNLVIYGPHGDRNLFGIGTLLSVVTGKAGPADWLGSEKLALPSFVLMSAWTVGAGMIILLAGLQAVPHYYYEAATLDGAGIWRRFRTITMPMLSPSLFFVLITSVISSFQVFTQIFVITSAGTGASSATLGGPNDSTRVYMIHLYDQGFMNLRMGYASAMSWILFFVIMAFTLIQFRLQRKVYYEAESG